MMSKRQKFSRIVFYSVWAVLMTALTYILGAVGLKVLRHKVGRSGYWVLTLIISAGLYAAHATSLAVAFFSLVMLMGVFSELEERRWSLLFSAFFTLLLNSLVAGAAFALWTWRTGPKWTAMVQLALETALRPLAQINSSIQINYSDLMMQLPSIVLIMWISAIYVAILLEGRLLAQEPRQSGGQPTMRQQLPQLRMPDPVVWLFILSLLGAFGGFEIRGLQAASTNVLNVTFMLFFFQGVAVVARLFERLRMGPFWQSVFMVLIIVHLFLFVSLVGLMDYWLDFRARLSKRDMKERTL